jgi:hypothetical protein
LIGYRDELVKSLKTQEESLNELKSDDDVGYIYLLSSLNFDDLYENFRLDRFSS